MVDAAQVHRIAVPAGNRRLHRGIDQVFLQQSGAAFPAEIGSQLLQRGDAFNRFQKGAQRLCPKGVTAIPIHGQRCHIQQQLPQMVCLILRQNFLVTGVVSRLEHTQELVGHFRIQLNKTGRGTALRNLGVQQPGLIHRGVEIVLKTDIHIPGHRAVNIGIAPAAVTEQLFRPDGADGPFHQSH